MKKRGQKTIIWLLLAAFVLSGCSDASLYLTPSHKDYDDGSEYLNASFDSFDSFDTAVLADVNKSQSTVTLYNYNLAKFYTLSYSGATRYADKYGTSIALSQLSVGDMVDVWFLKSRKTLAGMCESTGTFTESDISDFEFNTWAKTFSFKGETYRVSKDTFVTSGGQRIDISELNPMDSITLRGVGNTIYSIVVDNGHGYIVLDNADYFVGGYMEIGGNLIYQIGEKMLVLVPAGEYNIRITNKGTEVLRTVTVLKNEETVLDLSDVEIAEVKKQAVSLKLTPEDAKVSIDGKSIDTAYPVYCTYGMHKLVASANGYKTLTRYFNVDQNTKTLTVTLIEIEKEDVSANNTVSGNNPASGNDISGNNTSASTSASVSGNDTSSGGNGTSTSTSTSTSASTSDSTSTSTSASTSASDSTSTSASTNTSTSAGTDVSGSEGGNTDTGEDGRIYYVTFPAPEGVEIYWDGNYVGLAPISIKKTAGTHVITLRKNGYETRSFTVMLDDSKEDVSYTFDELVKKE